MAVGVAVFGLFTKMLVLCLAAFVAGAVVAWLLLRGTIRTLRAAARSEVRVAAPVAAVVIPAEAPSTGEIRTEVGTEPQTEARTEPQSEAEIPARGEIPARTERAVAPGITAEAEAEVEEASAEAECAVKGSAKSMIFHTPASPYFKRMKGDVTFPSPAEAERAGYTRWVPKARATSSSR